MNKISFFKYQGTGNDFIMIDNRTLKFKNDTKLINRLCDRKFGIGADGLICLENSLDNAINFKMVYYNADGRESSMCGNGGRCIVAFANFLGIIEKQCVFDAIDGLHEARVNEDKTIELKMKNVDRVEHINNDFMVDTGSPHYIRFIENEKDLDVKFEGAGIRYSERFEKEGINVNFVKVQDNKIIMRTYERGVEDETLSCGTGVTAAAITAFNQKKVNDKEIEIQTQGGQLKIRLQKTNRGYENIWLIGPAERVFKGEIEC